MKTSGVSPSPQMLKGRMQLYIENVKAEQANRTLTDIKGVREWRQIFRKLGTDPSRYRPSSEALLRRCLQNKPMFWVNTAVDVNNFCSLLHAIPSGIYDVEALSGDILCRLGGEEEQYEALNGRVTSCKGKLVTCDEQGPFGSPIVDSIRTRITEHTTEALQILYLYPDFPQPRHLLESVRAMFTQINGGEATDVRVLE